MTGNEFLGVLKQLFPNEDFSNTKEASVTMELRSLTEGAKSSYMVIELYNSTSSSVIRQTTYPVPFGTVIPFLRFLNLPNYHFTKIVLSYSMKVGAVSFVLEGFNFTVPNVNAPLKEFI